MTFEESFGAALDKLLRSQSERTNVIETLWRLYAHHAQVPPRGEQWVESRRAFFEGAGMLFEAFMRILEPGDEPTEADLRRVSLIADELQRFREDRRAGRG